MTPRDLATSLGLASTSLLLGAGGFLALRSLLRMLRRSAESPAVHLFLFLLSRGRR